MVKVTIKFDREACIGCGSCVSVCPDNWEMDESGNDLKVKPKKTTLSDVGCNKDAEDICPTGAIKVV